MAENKLNVMVRAEIGNPVPGKHALYAASLPIVVLVIVGRHLVSAFRSLRDRRLKFALIYGGGYGSWRLARFMDDKSSGGAATRDDNPTS